MLPKIDVPLYELKLISTGEKIKFRPFTVKEEKILMMAYESDDSKYAVDTIKQVLSNCVMGDVDVSELPTFDIEYLFLNLRARSVSEVVNLRYRCNNTVKNEETNENATCNNVVDIDLNVLEIEPTKNVDHSNKIELSENLGIVMKYPKMSIFENYANVDSEDINIILDLIVGCIDYIYDKEEIFYSKDATKEELMEFVESLQSKDLDKVKMFFDTMPKLTKKINFSCKKCGYNEEVELEGIQSFFG